MSSTGTVDALPPLPRVDESSAPFWEGARDRRLVILRCAECGRHIHWPRPVCRHCLADDLVPTTMSGLGVVYSFTIARQAFHPGFAGRLPYVIAVVELVEETGLRMLTNIVECAPEDVAIGAAVEVVFEPVTNDVTLPLFRLRRG